MELRTYIVPVVQLASQAAPWAFVGGLMLQWDVLTWIGVILFGASFVFALLTLPVEFNASARAKELLMSHGIIGKKELEGVDKVLDAAAWTYVAAAVSAIGVWLFYVFMLIGRGRSASAR
jgi:Zn-dependent membrane protease YugP